MPYSELAIETLTWKQARDHVHRLNPILAKIIDDINPDDSFRLYKTRYPYGTEILVNGRFRLPTTTGELVEVSKISEQPLSDDISYNGNTHPLLLVLNNTMELFLNMEDRVIPYSLVGPGDTLGIWNVVSNPYQKKQNTLAIDIWDMTAGARSIFLLPKVAEASGFHNVQKEYHVTLDAPRALKDHWQVFKEIATSPNFNGDWKVELLMFSKKWIDKLHDAAWIQFKSFLLDRAWQGGEFFRDKFTWDLTFTRIQTKRKIKPCPNVVDRLHHALAVSVGALPAFRPLIDDSVAPVKKLQQIFEETYKLRYAPVIIGPTNYSVFEHDSSVYLPFNYETAIQLSPQSNQRDSILTVMYNMNSLHEKYHYEIMHSDLKISDTVLYRLMKSVKFTYCHHDATHYPNMKSAQEIVSADSTFQQAVIGCKQQEMPKNAPFLNGCIQISVKK